MTKYKCGHDTDGVIIIDDSILSTAAYITWAYEDGGVFNGCETCWKCWNKEHDKRFKKKREESKDG